MKKKFNKAEFESAVIAHAWKDKEFRKLLLSNPKAALKKMDYDLPAHLNINVKEEEPNTFTLMLPQPPVNIEQLSESELRKIVGGGTGAACTMKGCHDYTAGC